MLNLSNRTNVILMGSRRTISANLQLPISDLSREALHILIGSRPGSRKPHVEVVDSELLHQVEDAKLLLDRGIFDRWRLQPIAQ